MSTNYYGVLSLKGGRDSESLHIGQSAAGWRFLMRAHPEKGLTSFGAWLDCLTTGGVVIQDEYGCNHTIGELFELVFATEMPDGRPRKSREPDLRTRGFYIDSNGVEFCAGEFR